MGLDNVAVQWPRTGRFYEPVAPAAFVDFAELADDLRVSAPTAALADLVAKTGAVRATAYTELVDLLLGLSGVLYAIETGSADDDDEDPVIDPDGCAWIAGGLERFVQSHEPYGEAVTFDTVGAVLHAALADGPLAEQQLRWLENRLNALRDESGGAPQWTFSRAELAVLGRFYRRCADRGYAVYADF